MHSNELRDADETDHGNRTVHPAEMAPGTGIARRPVRNDHRDKDQQQYRHHPERHDVPCLLAPVHDQLDGAGVVTAL